MKFKKIYIEITNVCNLHCPFCAGNKREPRFMRVEEFAHVLQQIKPYTGYLYLHVLGEPLLHPNLSALLAMAKQEGFSVNITTNGVLLPEKLPVLIDFIRQLNISLHSFSTHEIHPATYIEDCLHCGDVLAKHGTYISYRFWNQKGGALSQSSMDMVMNIAKHYNRTLTRDQKQKLEERRFLHFEEQFAWPSVKLAINDTKSTCYGMRSHCAILCDGSVVPCCLDSEGIMTLGNVFTTPFSDIISASRALRIEQGFQQAKIVEELCRHCTYRNRFTREDL